MTVISLKLKTLQDKIDALEKTKLSLKEERRLELSMLIEALFLEEADPNFLAGILKCTSDSLQNEEKSLKDLLPDSKDEIQAIGAKFLKGMSFKKPIASAQKEKKKAKS